jgi:heterodisulfide reductase subunit A-like polyferredoxin
MPRAYIDPQKCTCCPKCHAARICPIKVVHRLSDDEPAYVDMATCHGCGDCVSACPAKAVVLREG